jgi:hypothetical protein
MSYLLADVDVFALMLFCLSSILNFNNSALILFEFILGSISWV